MTLFGFRMKSVNLNCIRDVKIIFYMCATILAWVSGQRIFFLHNCLAKKFLEVLLVKESSAHTAYNHQQQYGNMCKHVHPGKWR